LFGGNDAAIRGWLDLWRRRLDLEAERATVIARMRRTNPVLIPRNHRVEEAIQAATRGDLRPFETLVEALATPYESRPEHSALEEPPKPEERVSATFCGT
jgi:serine/tyrosine/threonine adenylyltransferase